MRHLDQARAELVKNPKNAAAIEALDAGESGSDSFTVTVSDGDGALVEWAEPQRRVAPGQSAVVYDPGDTYVMGGGLVAR